MSRTKITLDLGPRSYPIFIGRNIVSELPRRIPKDTSKIFLLSDERLMGPRRRMLKFLKGSGLPVFEIPLRAGEGLKDIKSVYPIYGRLLELKADRNALIVALGGGSIGDAVGFVAATYLRGVNWMGVPTTLLSQVDSSVGGKTGINHSVGKNLIGSFHQPVSVLCETGFLKTLTQRELVSGLGEVVKYALAYDQKFFAYLEDNLGELMKGEPRALAFAIRRSLRWKCEAVAADEFDRKGPREVLNFGHTFAHALESWTRYKTYQHGEAVIWGMRFALALSEVRGHLSAKKRMRMDLLLSRLPVPALPRRLDKDAVFRLMKKDKKAHGETVRFVLLDAIGHGLSDSEVTPPDLGQAFNLLMKTTKEHP